MIQDSLSQPAFRHVPVSRGMAWWVEGWRNFLRAPWAWLGLSLVLFVVSALLHLLPFGGVLSQWLTLPLFALGAVFASVLRQRWQQQRRITPPGQVAEPDNEGAFGESSRRWSARIGPLMAASLLVLLLIILACLLLALAFGLVFGFGLLSPQAVEQWFQGSPGAMMAGMGMRIGLMLGLGLCVLVLVFLASTLFWFVGTLVALAGLRPWAAIRLSARAAMHNIGAILVFSILLVPFSILAMIPMGLGMLVLLPVLSGASYASFDDVFGAGAEAPREPG